jgi:hypothetical protein
MATELPEPASMPLVVCALLAGAVGHRSRRRPHRLSMVAGGRTLCDALKLAP